MFTAFNERNDFSYAFEKIRNAISSPGESNTYAATNLGLDILVRKYELFRKELDAAGELGDWEAKTGKKAAARLWAAGGFSHRDSVKGTTFSAPRSLVLASVTQKASRRRSIGMLL